MRAIEIGLRISPVPIFWLLALLLFDSTVAKIYAFLAIVILIASTIATLMELGEAKLIEAALFTYLLLALILISHALYVFSMRTLINS